jgi:hypothetical protein
LARATFQPRSPVAPKIGKRPITRLAQPCNIRSTPFVFALAAEAQNESRAPPAAAIDLPDGLFCNRRVQHRSQKYSASLLAKISSMPAPSRPDERGVRVVTDVGCGMRWPRRCVRRNATRADGEAVWYQCRRFEVPAELAASPRQELQIESGTGILNLLAPFASEVRKKGAAAGTNFGKRALAAPTLAFKLVMMRSASHG